MKVKCPVAGCDYIIKGADDGFKHWQKYDELHKTLHKNWINAFFPDLANSAWLDEVKFGFAYKKWHENETKQKIQAQKKKGQDTTDNITMKDGKVIYNNEEYTPEQFSQMQKGIKYLPLEHR